MSSTVSELNIFKDFEVNWKDKDTLLPKNMNNVTMEIYHYDGPHYPEIKVPLQEPYIFTETISDVVSISSIEISSNNFVDVPVILDLNLILTQLEGLGCAPNDFKVPNTNHKVAICNGYKKYALSACELATLINLEASGYSASADQGFLVLTGDFEGSSAYLQVGAGNFNTVVGLTPLNQYLGMDMGRVVNMPPTPMVQIDTGLYALTNIGVDDPEYKVGERYFVVYRGIDPTTNSEETIQENFTVLKPKTSSLNISFIK